MIFDRLFTPARVRHARSAAERIRAGAEPAAEMDAYAKQYPKVGDEIFELARLALTAAPERARPLGATAFDLLAQPIEAGASLHAGIAVRLLQSVDNDEAVARALVAPLNRETETDLVGLALKAHPELATGAALGAAFQTLARAGGGVSALALSAAATLNDLSTDNKLVGLAQRAAEGAYYSDTKDKIRNLALSSLDARGTPALAKLAWQWLDLAYAGKDQKGNWRDEKTPVMRNVLTWLGDHVETPEERVLVAMALGSLEAAAFSSTTEAVCRLALANLDSPPDARKLARLAEQMVEASTISKSAGKYRDDQTETARAVAAQLEQVPELAEVARLATAALAPGKFTSSNQAIARIAFSAMANGEKNLPRLARQMIEQATNSDNGQGKWQADKVRVSRAIIPVIKSQFPEAMQMLESAIEEVTFADTTSNATEALLRRLEDGQPTPQSLARVAADMVKLASTGTVGSDYKDDKTPVARACAKYLSQQPGPVGTYGAMLVAALDGRRFTDTNVAAAEAILTAAADQPDDPAQLARTARRVVDGALNSNNSIGNFQADKSRVAAKLREFLLGQVTDSAARQPLELWEAAIDGCTFASTAEELAKAALSAMAEGKSEPGRLCSTFVAGAYEGSDNSGAYRNDKAHVVVNLLPRLSGPLAELGQKATEHITYARTRVAVGEAVFKALAAGDDSLQAVARVGLSMVEGALATNDAAGQYHDDKTRVARAVLQTLAAHPQVGQQKLALDLGLAALEASHFTPSGVGCAEVTLRALRDDRAGTPVELGTLGRSLVEAGTVSGDRQDKGPIATAIFSTLAHQATDGPRRHRHLILRGMMNNNSDYRERTKVAGRALNLWANDQSPAPSALAREVLTSVPADDRLKMLRGAAQALADLSPTKPNLELDEAGLLALLDQLAPTTRAEVEALAAALNGESRELVIDDDALWVGDISVPVRD
ncbi:MAG: hypothetical protein AB7S38_37045 [Vulcanimicrobiota bacterium]